MTDINIKGKKIYASDIGSINFQQKNFLYILMKL